MNMIVFVLFFLGIWFCLFLVFFFEWFDGDYVVFVVGYCNVSILNYVVVYG